METKTFTVPNIGCDGCVKTIRSELLELDGVISVDGVVDTKTITMQYNPPTNWEIIVSTLKDMDYPPQA
ncbi:hypothetical protein MASR2M15_06720 [Anaerolineales bacterium]